MLINLRNALMAGKRLPYDAEVDWIRSEYGSGYSERAFIDTGVILQEATGNLKDFTLEYRVDAITRWGWFYAQLGTYVWLGSCAAFNNTIYFGTNTPSFHDDYSSATTCKFDSQTGWWRDGILVHEQATALASSGTIRERPLIFGKAVNVRGNATPDSYSLARIYWVKITVNGKLERDYVPIRITNELGQTEGALYDKVYDKVYAASGEIVFTAGPDKN